MRVPVLLTPEPQGLVRLSERRLTALIESDLPFVGVVTGPRCPRCTAFKAALEPVLEEHNLAVFEIPYFESYRTLKAEVRAQRATPRVYAFPTLLLFPRGEAGRAIPWVEEGVDALMAAFEAETEPSRTILTNPLALRGPDGDQHPTLVVPTIETEASGIPAGPLPERVKLVLRQGHGLAIEG